MKVHSPAVHKENTLYFSHFAESRNLALPNFPIDLQWEINKRKMNLKKFVEFLFFLKLQKSHPTKHRTGKTLAFSEFAKNSENALKNGSALAF